MSVILVHGGAGPHAGPGRDAKLAGVRRAADAGWSVLAAGRAAIEAVEAATRVLEDDPLFDAGLGSYLNLDGHVELDAILMDGATLRFGAVGAVHVVRHPVSLARLVMTDSPHAMLVAEGADRFAALRGLAVPPSELVAPEALAAWRAAAAADGGAPPAGGSTVGAVALDQDGHVAAATSTGGTRNKWPGRVGDSPIVGSGAYADDESGAVSSTGHGESIMRVCMARAACARLEAGDGAPAAAEAALALLGRRTGGDGGLIVVDRAGAVGWAWNTAAMPYAWRSDTGKGAGM